MTHDEALDRITELEQELRKSRTFSTDMTYWLENILPMLGPKALQVCALWSDKKISRMHVSWGPEGAATRGEDRAQIHLDMEAALASARLLDLSV